MPALQVKDFPSDLYEELRDCAAANDRNISQQTIRILREYLKVYKQAGGSANWVVRPSIEQPEKVSESRKQREDVIAERIERRKRIFEQIHAMPKIEIPDDFPEPAELIRQMREERDDQIVPELSHIR